MQYWNLYNKVYMFIRLSVGLANSSLPFLLEINTVHVIVDQRKWNRNENDFGKYYYLLFPDNKVYLFFRFTKVKKLTTKRVQVIASLVCLFAPCLAAPGWNSRFPSGVGDPNVANAKVNEASFRRPVRIENLIKEIADVKRQKSAFRHSTIVNVIALPDEDYQPPEEEILPQDSSYCNQYYFISYFLTPNNNLIPIYSYYWPSYSVYSLYDY